MKYKISYKRVVYVLIVVSTLLRVFFASQLEFGNDEVYYWLYAKYPDISHFDHPPFVGFFIQLFTFDLFFDSELAIRLAAIIPGSINMYLLFLIGCKIKNELVGFLSVILYNLNIYALIIAGTFILPDAPLLFFWLLSFYFLIEALPLEPSKDTRKKLFIAFFFIACAIYSKYQAVFLLVGVVLYIVFINRIWLKDWSFYLSFIFPLITVSLIVYWNYQYDFISYKFHNNRVSLFSLSFNKDSFLREVLGQMVYNNPYIFFSIHIMTVALIRKKFIFEKKQLWLFIFFSFPLIFTTIYLSLYKDTLPHWSGISYVTLLPLLAVYIHKNKKIERNLIRGGVVLMMLMVFTSIEINKGWFLPIEKNINKEEFNNKDALMDMYGWKQLSAKITPLLETKNLKSIPIISDKWFPLAHIDYYIARPNKMDVYGIGELTNIHKYYWINKKKKKLTSKDVLYLTDSRNYRSPKSVYGKSFNQYNLLKTIPIKRNDKIVKYVFLYLLIKD
ncbi:glycosyltransferase family 39 protein [uncultured Tenacibaculum sp.]|uniref:ArnT family glycosyltransferase n=1 Tax=uncultured Tenacibaculum sp. TaxID=174713 RepID=UPI00262679FD|nr:glycosyltransferase family 39 protein [uncultured Tenacibaculum sp.]